MKIKVQIIIDYETGEEVTTHEVACLTREFFTGNAGSYLCIRKELIS